MIWPASVGILAARLPDRPSCRARSITIMRRSRVTAPFAVETPGRVSSSMMAMSSWWATRLAFTQSDCTRGLSRSRSTPSSAGLRNAAEIGPARPWYFDGRFLRDLGRDVDVVVELVHDVRGEGRLHRRIVDQLFAGRSSRSPCRTSGGSPTWSRSTRNRSERRERSEPRRAGGARDSDGFAKPQPSRRRLPRSSDGSEARAHDAASGLEDTSGRPCRQQRPPPDSLIQAVVRMSDFEKQNPRTRDLVGSIAESRSGPGSTGNPGSRATVVSGHDRELSSCETTQ